MQNKFYYRTIFALAVCGLTYLFSCRQQMGNPSWDVDALAPLIKSTLTINNIIPDSLLRKNPNNSLDLVYNSLLTSFSADKLLKIPDTTLANTKTYPFGTTII